MQPDTKDKMSNIIKESLKNDDFGEIIYGLKNKIEGMKALQAPYNLALIRHGSRLAEKLIAEGPPRNKKNEIDIEPVQNKPQNILKNSSFEEIDFSRPEEIMLIP